LVDLVSVGLVLFSVILFAVTLGLSFKLPQNKLPQNKLPQKAKFDKKPEGPAKGSPEENKQNTIILKLPDNGKYTGNYNLDFKVSLVDNKKNELDEKENGITEQRKKFYRRLDEYF